MLFQLFEEVAQYAGALGAEGLVCEGQLGVHCPKGLNPQLWEQFHWVNEPGVKLPKEIYRNA